MGGVRMDRAQSLEQKNRREAAAGALKQSIEKIQEFGCLVKDLDIGLIDFPTLFQGQEVYLCWKLGEDGIRFWHGVHEGFRGRKADRRGISRTSSRRTSGRVAQLNVRKLGNCQRGAAECSPHKIACC